MVRKNLSNLNAPYPWQINQWQQLWHTVKTERMPHAVLLHGTLGLGKRDFAELFAKNFLCSHISKNEFPCGQCRDCRWCEQESHPDLLVIQAEETGHAIKIAQVRELIEFFSKTRHGAPYKIAIIDPIDALNISAANALLKTLEEPPDHCFLFLTTSQLSSVPATIRSRCQLLYFPGHTFFAEKVNWLKMFTDEKTAKVALHVTEGSPIAAKNFLTEEKMQERQETLVKISSLVQQKEDPIRIAQTLLKMNIQDCLNWMLTWLSDGIRLNMNLPLDKLLNQDQLELLQQSMSHIDIKKCYSLFDKLITSYRQQHSNLNQQLLLESICCAWAELKGKHPASIMERPLMANL